MIYHQSAAEQEVIINFDRVGMKQIYILRIRPGLEKWTSL